MTKDVNVNQLATAVMWWLSYTSAVGRNYVLSEGSIKFPASEYLERSTTEEIELEYNHPKLSRKRFDLFYRKNSNEEVAFEFKYVKNGSTRDEDEKQRIFNDLMRLFLFLDTNHKSYFLICGNQNDFVKDFQKIKPPKSQFITPRQQGTLPTNIISEGFYTKWFSFDGNNPSIEINLKNPEKGYEDIYDIFFKEYNDPHLKKTKTALQRPDKIKTTLVFLSGHLDQPVGLFQPAKIGIWEISKEV